MKNTLKIDRENGLIVMDRTFAKLSENTRSEEYTHLQQVRKDYPTFQVVTRTIKKNPKKETYAGLTYDYMKFYIFNHEPAENRRNALAEFDELILISKCHAKAKRYPTIKKWFLEKYPEIVQFGMPAEEPTATKEIKVAEMPATTQKDVA